MKKGASMWGIIVVFVGLAMAGCWATGGHVTDSTARVKAADWNKMQTVDVILQEYSYRPSTLKFQTDIPYKIRILNKGTEKHYFTAEEFFKAIATRKVQSNADGEIKAPYFSALEVFPGRSLDLYFVPVKKGTYKLHCTIEGHEAKGMHGIIVIE
jgi:uncharacterized cupredoxin-like copper-binding protein